MYQFLNTPAAMGSLIHDCALPVGKAGEFGSAMTFGDDPFFPNVILFFDRADSHITDPARTFILEKTLFRYREVT